MKLEKLLLLAGLSAISLLASCSSVQTISSTKVATGIVKIDGNESDWNEKTIVFADKQVAVGAQYDEKYIYVCLKSNDQTTIRKILGLGLNLTFENIIDSKEAFTIKYPLGGPGPRMRKEDSIESNPDQEKANKPNPGVQPLEEAGLVLNYDELNKTIYPLAELEKIYGINVKTKREHELIIYEIAVPRTGKLLNLKIDEKTTDPFVSLKIETNEFKRPDFAGARPNGAPTGGMTGGMPGGGMGGGEAMPGGMGAGMGGSRGGRGTGVGGSHNRPNSNAMKEMSQQLELKIKIAPSANGAGTR